MKDDPARTLALLLRVRRYLGNPSDHAALVDGTRNKLIADVDDEIRALQLRGANHGS